MGFSRLYTRSSIASKRFLSTARAIVFPEYGAPRDVLKIQSYDPSNLKGSVQVKFLGSTINPADLNQIEGVYPSKPRFTKELGSEQDLAVAGNEGVVEITEAETGSGFTKGTWALMRLPGFGTWRTHAAAEPKDLVPIDNAGLSVVQAATLSINPSTAYRLLTDFVNLEKGDWFIQNAANSAVGKAAIQIGKIRGYKSINIIRDRESADKLKQHLMDLGADLVLTDKELMSRESAKKTIQSVTQKAPVRLGLNAVCGKILSEMSRYIGTGGVVVTYGAMSKQPIMLPASLFIFKDITFRGMWVSKWNSEHPAAQKEMLDEITGWVRNGKLNTTDTQCIRFNRETADNGKALESVLAAPEDHSLKKILIME